MQEVLVVLFFKNMNGDSVRVGFILKLNCKKKLQNVPCQVRMQRMSTIIGRILVFYHYCLCSVIDKLLL